MTKWIISILLFLLTLRLFIFYQQREIFHAGQQIELESVLFTESTVNGRIQHFFVRAGNGQRVYITASVYPAYHYGESLYISGTIQLSEKGTPFLSFPEIKLKENKTLSGRTFSFFGNIRSRVIAFFESTLPPTGAGLLLGIVFGIREQIPGEFYSALKSSGVLHVIAASGMNVNIVIALFAGLVIRFIKRQYALAIIIPAVLFYAIIAGFDPPIVRACLMGLLAITAAIIGRQYFGLLALFITAWIMLMLWPQLLFDIGFQLSFFATLGIIVIEPLLPFAKVSRIVVLPAQDLRTTIAAQIMTLPILMFAFGQYGILSLLANALVLWMVPVLMALGLLAAVAIFFVPPLAFGILLLTMPLLAFFEKAITLVGGLHADILFKMPFSMVVGYYLLLGAGVLLIRNRKTRNPKHEIRNNIK